MNDFQRMSAQELADELQGLADGQDDDMGLLLQEAAARLRQTSDALAQAILALGSK